MGRYPALSRLAPETWNGAGNAYLQSRRVKLISMTRPCMSLITVLIIFPGFLARSSAPDDNSRMVMVRTVFVRSAGTMLDFRSLLDL
ncbi:hypothetical protein CEXT_308631 [Caerostris extrusa]|uniref:Uncharacterized protein n=1 Tax=Caerostris extrusa TaxID=172846 RepID=A0AAV4XPV8_CAEEX|nr:hypothetical protein CEXT_308631 [Caerostris extrusa]